MSAPTPQMPDEADIPSTRLGRCVAVTSQRASVGPIVDNHKWRNLLFMVKIEELQRYCELHFNYGFGRENQAVRDMRANRTCKCIILSMR